MGYPIYHSQYTAAQIEAAIGKGPRVNTAGYWEIWNVGTGAYESTGVGAGVTPPTVVTQVSQMTNHGYIYIYNGTETGYTAGYWYYWDGSAWTAGGAYQVAATDTTLTVTGAAADAKATGDKIGELKSALDIYTESKTLDADYRQGWMSNSTGKFNTSNSGKSYLFDIQNLSGDLYIKCIGNNVLNYGLYTQARSEMATIPDAAVFKGLWVGGAHPDGFTLSYGEYSSYKTLLVTTDYNNSTPAKIFGYEQTTSKAELAEDIGVLQESLGKDLIPMLAMEAGNINSGTGEDDSSSTRIRSKDYLPKMAGILSSTNADGGFYLYAWEGSTFKGGFNGTIITTGSTKQRIIDIGALAKKYPTYKFRIVYLIDNGTATISNVSELRLSNVFYPVAKSPSEKIRVMFNNLGGMNYGTHATGNDRMSTSDALAKIEAYKQFYAEYQPNILALEEYSMDTSQMSKYIDKGDSVCPDTDLYPYIYPYTTTPYQYATIKSDFSILTERNLAISLPGFDYALRGSMAEIQTPEGRVIGTISTVFDVNGTEENKIAQMAKCVELLENYDYAMLCVDTNMLSSEEFEDMASLFTTAGYQMANGGFYPLIDTCPSAVYKPIDNIFVKGRVKLKSFIVPNVLSDLASDHLPVLSDVLLY